MITIDKATTADIESIHGLILGFAAEGLILERSKDEIQTSIDKFFAARIDGNLAGIISYYDYGFELKEIRSLAVDKKYSGRGVGSKLVAHLISVLREKSSPKIFALTYSPDFFIKNGFIEVDKATLPEKIWKDCYKCDHRDICGETALIYPA